jgi:hypothetical protein
MEVIQTFAKKTKKGYSIQLPEISSEAEVQVVVVVQSGAAKSKPEKFFGKLKWKGDAMAWQKKIRDEWE